jgi:hypothetical protein
MEKKSARILAVILAFIMLGSVFAYMMRGTRNVETREVVIRLDDFREYVKYVPRGAIFFEYVNMSYLQLPEGDQLRYTVNKMLQDLLIREIFSRSIIEIPHGFTQILRVYYPNNMPLYFVDAKMTKIYFAKQDEMKVGNYSVPVRPGIALFDKISPFVIGNPTAVRVVVEIFQGKDESVANETYPYLSRINGSFLYAWFTFGEAAGRVLKVNNTSISDFFFEGWGYNPINNTYYKTWGVHFIGNYFFSKTNETEFCKIKNFEDGFSVAVLEDRDFGKIVQAQPRILSYKITFKPVNTTNES